MRRRREGDVFYWPQYAEREQAVVHNAHGKRRAHERRGRDPEPPACAPD